MAHPGLRFSYRHFLSGNVSLPAALFQKVGGFDPSLDRREDYELGLRLLKSGARFRYVPAALGQHYIITDLAIRLRHTRQEGMADVRIGQRHPELRAHLFGGALEVGDYRRLRVRKFAWIYPRSDWLEQHLLHIAATCERLRLRGPWHRVVVVLREYSYWGGVATALGNRQMLAAWLQEAPMPPSVASNAPTVDMAHLPPAQTFHEVLAQATTLGLRVCYDGSEILTLAPQPGVEPLREEHLHSVWHEVAAQQFIPTLALHLIRSTAEGGVWCSSNLPRWI